MRSDTEKVSKTFPLYYMMKSFKTEANIGIASGVNLLFKQNVN